MNVVIISPFQYELKRGIERFSFSLANEFAKSGYNVTIYAWRYSGSVNWGKWHSNVKLRFVPKVKYYIRFLASIYYHIWLKLDKPNFIILNFLYHGEQYLPRNLKYIYVLNSPASQVPHRYKFIAKIVNRFLYFQFVAVSEMVRKDAIKILGNKLINVIPNGVDTKKFLPKDFLFINKTDEIRLISASALEERKGLQFIIQAIHSVRNLKIKYDIFGEGLYFDQLITLIDNLKLSSIVRIHEPVNNLEDILPEYDVFCLPSKGEAFALAPIEALSCGIPILVSNNPPFDELIIGPFGQCVDVHNSSEIIYAILQLKEVKWSNVELIRNAALKYDWSNIAEEYKKIMI